MSQSLEKPKNTHKHKKRGKCDEEDISVIERNLLAVHGVPVRKSTRRTVENSPNVSNVSNASTLIDDSGPVYGNDGYEKSEKDYTFFEGIYHTLSKIITSVPCVSVADTKSTDKNDPLNDKQPQPIIIDTREVEKPPSIEEQQIKSDSNTTNYNNAYDTYGDDDDDSKSMNTVVIGHYDSDEFSFSESPQIYRDSVLHVPEDDYFPDLKILLSHSTLLNSDTEMSPRSASSQLERPKSILQNIIEEEVLNSDDDETSKNFSKSNHTLIRHLRGQSEPIMSPVPTSYTSKIDTEVEAKVLLEQSVEFFNVSPKHPKSLAQSIILKNWESGREVRWGEWKKKQSEVMEIDQLKRLRRRVLLKSLGMHPWMSATGKSVTSKEESPPIQQGVDRRNLLTKLRTHAPTPSTSSDPGSLSSSSASATRKEALARLSRRPSNNGKPKLTRRASDGCYASRADIKRVLKRTISNGSRLRGDGDINNINADEILKEEFTMRWNIEIPQSFGSASFEYYDTQNSPTTKTRLEELEKLVMEKQLVVINRKEREAEKFDDTATGDELFDDDDDEEKHDRHKCFDGNPHQGMLDKPKPMGYWDRYWALDVLQTERSNVVSLIDETVLQLSRSPLPSNEKSSSSGNKITPKSLASRLKARKDTMGTFRNKITPKQIEFLLQQHIFFVATAPLSAKGFVNLSPKGHADQCFWLLNDTTAVYLDLTGSGFETVAHLRENGRLTIMFCAFNGPPQIMRLLGNGKAIEKSKPEFDKLIRQISNQTTIECESLEGSAIEKEVINVAERAVKFVEFSKLASCRAAIMIDISLVGQSCGFSVPFFNFEEDRPVLLDFFKNKTPGEVEEYQIKKNSRSLNGLPGFLESGRNFKSIWMNYTLLTIGLVVGMIFLSKRNFQIRI
ncbi:hypothetical protein HK098_003364 [Nowakowskiella sp. JEL0407]|nr:hypothetical protein HK098_003364 [Nowakowskiella sp. JEL0407]